MSSISTLAIFTAGLAAFAPTAVAFTKPVGASPSGNAIDQPGLNSVVPAGEQFSVVWEPTTKDCSSVDLVLLKGPSSNAVPISTLVENYPNNGTYTWTPSTDLAPQTVGYGIQLICDESGAYQYTTQFGISNPDYVAPESTSSAATSSASSSASSAVAKAATTSAKPIYVTDVVSRYTTYCPYATQISMNNKTYTVSSATTLTITDCPCTITRSSYAGAVTGVPSSGYLPANSSIVKPTGNVTVPTSLRSTVTSVYLTSSSATTTTASSSSVAAAASATPTGAAEQLGTTISGLVFAAGIAMFAL